MREPTAAEIISDVCFEHMVPVKEVVSICKRKPVVFARHEIFYRIRTEKKWSYYRIAKLFGYHHSTIMDGVIKHQQRQGEANEKVYSMDTRREKRTKAYA